LNAPGAAGHKGQQSWRRRSQEGWIWATPVLPDNIRALLMYVSPFIDMVESSKSLRMPGEIRLSERLARVTMKWKPTTQRLLDCSQPRQESVRELDKVDLGDAQSDAKEELETQGMSGRG